MEEVLKVSLLEHYLAQRQALQRFLAARLRDEQIAEDILQEMYLKLERTTVENAIENPTAFLYRVANNLVLDYRKAASRRRVRDHNWSDSQVTLIGKEPVEDIPDADRALDARRRFNQLTEGMKGLPPKCQSVFMACKIQGMTYKEAAAHHGVSVGTVEKHISKALKYLLAYMGSEQNDHD